jgi:hypothetical protein
MKMASLKSRGGFVFNTTTNRYEWDNNLVNNTEVISLFSDDIWYIFSNKVIRSSVPDGSFGEPGELPYSSIADLFSSQDADYVLFFDRDNIFANTANFTQIYNPDYYTFTIYKQRNFDAPSNVFDAYELVKEYCQVQSDYLNRLKFSPALIDDEKIVFKANTQLVRTIGDNPEETLPESEIITDADYVIIEYIWAPAAGTDLDTRTQIQGPGTHPVVGWNRATNDSTVLHWNNDNTGTGREGILINIKEYAKSNLNELAVSLRAFWYSTRGTGAVTLKATAYRGGNMVANSFGWDNYGGTIVSTTMASINVVTRQSSDIDGEYVGTFYYDLTTKTGKLVTGGSGSNPGNGDGGAEETPPVINCTPTSFNITQIQGDTTKEGNVIVVASIWYEGQEYPYITTREQMRYVVANVDGSKVGLASGFNTGINIYDKVYNRYPEFCKAIVLARNRTDNFFIAGAGMGNLEQYAMTPRVWDMRPYEQSFKIDSMQPVEAPSQLRLTKLSPEMQQFIKDNHDYGIFFNGNYNVNNLVDMINQGNDIIIDACIKVESNMFDTTPEEPPVEPETPSQVNPIEINKTATMGIAYSIEPFEVYAGDTWGWMTSRQLDDGSYISQPDTTEQSLGNTNSIIRDFNGQSTLKIRKNENNDPFNTLKIIGDVISWGDSSFEYNTALPADYLYFRSLIADNFSNIASNTVLTISPRPNGTGGSPNIISGSFIERTYITLQVIDSEVAYATPSFTSFSDFVVVGYVNKTIVEVPAIFNDQYDFYSIDWTPEVKAYANDNGCIMIRPKDNRDVFGLTIMTGRLLQWGGYYFDCYLIDPAITQPLRDLRGGNPATLALEFKGINQSATPPNIFNGEYKYSA